MDCVIIGYTRGKGDRASQFGALQIAEETPGGLKYRGKVGTGFDAKRMDEIYEAITSVEQTERPVEEKPLDEKNTTWIEPALYCQVQYASITPNGTLREPVFLRIRPDF